MAEHARFLREHPGVFYLDSDDLSALREHLLYMGWIRPLERVVAAEKPGDGNMNHTLLVRTDQRTFILKQARPWVEKYPLIPAPWDRAIVEGRFYELIGGNHELARNMPRLLGMDPYARLLCFEDLGISRDFTSVYAGDVITMEEFELLVRFMTTLHEAYRQALSRDLFKNIEMRRLNHQHIFVLPLSQNNGLDLDSITPGLQRAAQPLQSDSSYKDKVLAAGEIYLSDGPCLLHGDYFPGSWLRSPAGLRIIDPEFCFFGPPEFDAGVLLAHLHLARQPHRLMDRLCELCSGLDQTLVNQFAGIEIMRRLIGVAQLPLRMTLGEKRDLLDLSKGLV